MAAIDSVLRLLAPGDHVLCSNDVYGGTFRLFERVFRPYGLDFSYVDTADLDRFDSLLRPTTRLVWLETPSNPLLNVTDIAALAGIAHGWVSHPWVVVDNTFATPYLQRPLELGADLSLHSTTKYLGGHSDVVGGAVLLNDPELHRRLAFLQNAVGAVPGPLDCFLVLRGVKTLPVRMERHSANALTIARFLSEHPKVARVLYPFHDSHPQFRVARRQMREGGGMLSFILKEGAAAARRVAERTRLFCAGRIVGRGRIVDRDPPRHDARLDRRFYRWPSTPA